MAYQYKDYQICAEVETTEFWHIDDNGQPVEHESDGDHFEIVGYSFLNFETGDSFYHTSDEKSIADLHTLVNMRIGELNKVVNKTS